MSANAGEARNMGPIPGSGRSLEEEMATLSSILAWEISQTEETGRLQPVGSQRAGHDSVCVCMCVCEHAYTHTHSKINAAPDLSNLGHLPDPYICI